MRSVVARSAPEQWRNPAGASLGGGHDKPTLAQAWKFAGEGAVLEMAGIEFIDENGGGPGVRLRNRQRPKQSK